VTLWEIDIHPAEGQPDRAGARIAAAARELGLAANLTVAAARGYLVQGESLERGEIERLANELLADVVVEQPTISRVSKESSQSASRQSTLDSYCVTVL
jgi:phosphoribosylformylglycinamidine synthase